MCAHIGFTLQYQQPLGRLPRPGGRRVPVPQGDGPGYVAGQVTKELAIPTIGIGAGNQTVAQVLVWRDAFGLNTGASVTVRQAVLRPARRAPRRRPDLRWRGRGRHLSRPRALLLIPIRVGPALAQVAGGGGGI